jgi:hypothetical protein
MGVFKDEGRNSTLARFEDFAHFNTDHRIYCRVTVQAPWRETPGPTWQFVAGMLRNQQKGFQEPPAKQPNQQRLPFVD